VGRKGFVSTLKWLAKGPYFNTRGISKGGDKRVVFKGGLFTKSAPGLLAPL